MPTQAEKAGVFRALHERDSAFIGVKRIRVGSALSRAALGAFLRKESYLGHCKP